MFSSDSDSGSDSGLIFPVSRRRGPSNTPTSRDMVLRTLKSNFGRLWGNQRLADLSICVKLKPAAESSAPEAVKEEKEQEASAAGPTAQQQEREQEQEGVPAVESAEQQQGQEQQTQHEQDQKGEQEAVEGPAAKRVRTEEDDAHAVAGTLTDQKQGQGQQKQAGWQPVDTSVAATMRVHGVVLAQRSKYFERMLLGGGAGMVEGQTKSLTIEVEDDQEAADFQRLIKLFYMASYTEEDGRALSKEELLRLLVMANGYEMVWCVEECARALAPFNGYDDALVYFQCVPDSLLYTEPLRSATIAAGSALAVALGWLEKLWRPADTYSEMLEEAYIVDERVVALPIGGIEALLRSEELQIRSENYTFSLGLWWVMKQEGDVDEELQPLFNRMLKSLRYARMSALFLASIAQLEWVEYSGLATSILTRGLWRRDNVPKRFPTNMPSSRVEMSNRHSYSVVFRTHFTRTDVEALQKYGDMALSPLGLLHGLPCCLALKRKIGGRLALQVWSNFLSRNDEGLTTPDKPDYGGQDDNGARKLEFVLVRGEVGGMGLRGHATYYTGTSSASTFFGRGYIPDNFVYDEAGKLNVELELKVMQHNDC